MLRQSTFIYCTFFVIAFGVVMTRLTVAQVKDQVLVTALGTGAQQDKPLLLRFDRKLQLIGQTDFSSIGSYGWGNEQKLSIGPSGHIWILSLCPNPCVVLLDKEGRVILPMPYIGLPYALTADRYGNAFVATTYTSSQLGPLVKVNLHGGISFSNPNSTLGVVQQFPTHLATTPDGYIWLAGNHYDSGANHPRLVKIDPNDGTVLATQDSAWSTLSLTYWRMFATVANDVFFVTGGLYSTQPWTLALKIARQDAVVETSSFFWFNGVSSISGMTDANGKYYMAVGETQGLVAHQIARFNPITGAIEKLWELTTPLPTHIEEMCMGPTGEEILLRRWKSIGTSSFIVQLVKLNTVSGQASWVDLTPTYNQDLHLALGDPSGFILANCIDPLGDNDGDGYVNRDELIQGYNAYDPYSRPGGPKVYLWFDKTKNNKILIKYVDPDGILSFPGGLDLTTLSVWAKHPVWGEAEVFWDLAAYLTDIVFSPDGTEVTLDYGASALPYDLGWELTASISDLTGAAAWDWQHTPKSQ